jgi:hypothetical protein
VMSAAYQQPGLGESGGVARKTIPFEYAFRYSLTGIPGTTLSNTVTVSIESPFVAVSIGYGVIPVVSTLTFGATLPTGRDDLSLGKTTFSQMIESIANTVDEKAAFTKGTIGPGTAAVLTNGLRLNPRLAGRLLLGRGDADLDSHLLAEMFEAVGAPAGQVQFLYSLRDEGTGREFQSQPILNTAGLGIADGDRPFRYFAAPISFAPRSAIRMDVTEVSDFKGELHVALHGYKVLGGAGTPTDTASAMRRRSRRIRHR